MSQTCPNGHPIIVGDLFCGQCGEPPSHGEPDSRSSIRRWVMVAAAAVLVGLAIAGAVVRWPDANQTNGSQPASEPVGSSRPADGKALCADPPGDVTWRTGRGTLNTVQTSNGRAVDITEVSVTIADGDLDLRLDFFSAPFEYDSGTLYAYDIGIYKPGDGDPLDRKLYTAYIGSDGIGTPGAPSRTERFHGADGDITSATFEIQGRSIAVTVPIKDLPSLPARFEFSAHANFTVPFADTPDPGLWDDSCPATNDPDGAMTGVRLPTFPTATATTTTEATTTSTPPEPGSLPPATVAPVIEVCEIPIEPMGAAGVPGPIDCNGPGINKLAWESYATEFPYFLSLGPTPTTEELWNAHCAAMTDDQWAGSVESSAIAIAALYYGWPDSYGADLQDRWINGTETCP